ncbi:MAG: hypothetical protein OXF84_01825 [Bacteroidetes bacterium]|nr:hypothetical protein [Bacteroidota bacterium]
MSCFALEAETDALRQSSHVVRGTTTAFSPCLSWTPPQFSMFRSTVLIVKLLTRTQRLHTLRKESLRATRRGSATYDVVDGGGGSLKLGHDELIELVDPCSEKENRAFPFPYHCRSISILPPALASG